MVLCLVGEMLWHFIFWQKRGFCVGGQKGGFLCLSADVALASWRQAWCCSSADCSCQMQALIFAHCQSPVNGTANTAGKEGVKVQIETMPTLLAWGQQDLHSALQLLNKSKAVSDRSQHTFFSTHPLMEKSWLELLSPLETWVFVATKVAQD